ncbi:piriformospora indica-insensitive protein 2-like [Senna tora]|uniref:Piriformospora indica-insensitive protein 2-like n=1 Tax=Senna tora TaxID=362788 RepID=A0A834SLS2_9FABA|nr:piriformospora indica-insensitive protein 2-like [Senna tora]
MAVNILVNVLLLGFLGLFFLCKGQNTSVSLSPMKKKEQETLYSVIQGFIGKEWNGSDLYPDPCGWTPIQGVSCELYDNFWYVTVLNLGPVFDNSYICTHDAQFPDQLFKLKHLKVLSLTGCFLSPTQNPVRFPISHWENFSNSLESLHLRSNPGLVGTIPSTFGYLRKLQSLVLLENGLTGELPSNIGNLVRLRQLVLSGNHFVGEIPFTYGGLSELLILDASRNDLSGALPSTIGFLGSLLKLDLSNNFLEGELPRELGRLKNLLLLDLSHNKLRGGLVGTLEELVSLQHMVMSNNPIGGNLLGIEWKSFQNMESLDFSEMGLTGNVPESMAEMKRLRYLDLSNNNLSGSLFRSLENLPYLAALHLNGNNLTGRLEFSEWFYSKMGKRFTAWDNANLCYIARSMLTWTQTPHGVKLCVHETSLFEETSKMKTNDKDSNFMSSSGSSRCISYGFWWVLNVNVVFHVFIWNMSR